MNLPRDFSTLIVQDLWDAGSNLRSDANVPEQHQLPVSSQILPVPWELAETFCVLFPSQGVDFSHFCLTTCRDSHLSIDDSKLESLGEKSLPSDSSSVILEE